MGRKEVKFLENVFDISKFRNETAGTLITTIGLIFGQIKIDEGAELAHISCAKLIPLSCPGSVIDLGVANILLSHVLGTSNYPSR